MLPYINTSEKLFDSISVNKEDETAEENGGSAKSNWELHGRG